MTNNKTRRSPITKQGEETVSSILDAVEYLLKTLGYAKLTAKKISTQAGIGTGSFYQYFSNKTEAVEALAERWLDSIEVTFFSGLEEQKGSESISIAISNICHEILTNHYQNYAAYEEIYNISSRSDSLDRAMALHNKKIAEGIGQLLDTFSITYDIKNKEAVCEFIRTTSIFLISQISFEQGETKDLKFRMSLSMLKAMFEVDLS